MPRKKNAVFVSKADTPELREYQRTVSQFPPLSHDEIIYLSRRFIRGRNIVISNDEHNVIDAVLDGDWSDDSLREHKEAVIAAYSSQISWLSGDLDGEKMIEDMLGPSPAADAFFCHRYDNIMERLPWLEPISLADFLPKDGTNYDLCPAFIQVQNSVITATKQKIDAIRPVSIPKDVIDQWKIRKAEISKRYMVTVKTMEQTLPERTVRIAATDSEYALEQIINHNLQLAMSRISKMMKTNPKIQAIGISDLIGAANMGLVLGARQFNPEMGRKFSTYATFHIDGQLRELAQMEDNKAGIQGMSLHESKQLTTIISVKMAYEAFFDRAATLLELQSLTGISANKISERLKTPNITTQSLNSLIGGDEKDGTTLEDTIEDPKPVETYDTMERYEEVVQDLRDLVLKLPDVERQVVMGKMGITKDGTQTASPKTSRKLAGELKITIKQVEASYVSALDKLRSQMTLIMASKEAMKKDDTIKNGAEYYKELIEDIQD